MSCLYLLTFLGVEAMLIAPCELSPRISQRRAVCRGDAPVLAQYQNQWSVPAPPFRKRDVRREKATVLFLKLSVVSPPRPTTLW